MIVRFWRIADLETSADGPPPDRLERLKHQQCFGGWRVARRGPRSGKQGMVGHLYALPAAARTPRPGRMVGDNAQRVSPGLDRCDPAIPRRLPSTATPTPRPASTSTVERTKVAGDMPVRRAVRNSRADRRLKLGTALRARRSWHILTAHHGRRRAQCQRFVAERFGLS